MAGAVDKESDGALLIRALAAHDGAIGDPRRFGPHAVDVVAEARNAGAVEALVVGLRAMAWVERSRMHNPAALRMLDEAVRIARRASLAARLGEVLTTRSAVLQELGRVDAARRDLDRAAQLVDDGSMPELQLKRATLLHNVGRIAEAAEVYRRLLAGDRASVDVRVRAANNLALTQSLRGHGRDAERWIDLATELAAQTGPGLVANVAQNRGLVLSEAGKLAEGLDQADRAIELLAAAGLPLGESLVELAETLAALRALPEAADAARRAVDAFDESGVPLMAAEARLKVAEIALLRADHVTAVAEGEAAAARFRAQRRVSWAALGDLVAVEAAGLSRELTPREVARVRRAGDTLHRLGLVSAAVRAGLVSGRAACAAGRTEVAVRLLKEARHRSARGPLLVRLRGRLAAALAAEIEGDTREMLRQCRTGLTELAAHRSSLASTELRALAAGHGLELGLLGMGCLLRAGTPSRVLDWAERTRSAALLAVGPPAPDEVREERAELAAVYGEIAAARRDQGIEPAALLDRQTALEHRVRRAVWHRSAASGGRTPGAMRTAQVVDLLGERTLVSYVRHDDRFHAVVVSSEQRRLVTLGPSAPVYYEGDSLQFALRRLTRPGSDAAIASARSSAAHALERLTDALVRPLGIDPESPLVVIPARDTHRLPWAALHDGPVSVAPSATLWATTAAAAGAVPSSAGRVVVVAGPGLRGARHEAEVVGRCHARSTVLLPPAGTSPVVLDAIEEADLVHFACHGHLRADNPTFSSLEVTDGCLTVQEFDLRGIAPRRVVLAACDSAADIGYDGGELVGFVSALLSRGTVGLVASVVAIGDVEAVELMSRLHVSLADGTTMADALHTARGKVDRSDPRGFVNWCSFTAYGAG